MTKKKKPDRRTVLFVDHDPEHTLALCNAWSQLRLADELRLAESRDEALEMLQKAGKNKDIPPVAAVVLDPETTGEGTGQFMRDVRKYCGGAKTPVVFWSRNGQQYEVLEGLGVESILRKPMVLRLIQALDAACHLKTHDFPPFPGSALVEQSGRVPHGAGT